MSTLKEYYGDFAKTLTSRFAVISYLQHSLAKGLQNEEILRNFLATYLPKQFSVGTGFVLPETEFESKINLSRQIDILIFDSSRYAPILSVNDFHVVREDAVAAVIEVKTKLYSEDFSEALENIASTKAINPMINGYIFAFQKSARDETMKKALEQITQTYSRQELPDGICVLEGQVLKRLGEYIVKYETETDQLAIFYYTLLGDLAKWAGLREIADSYQDIQQRVMSIFF
ncbi:MAG: hypothetical protein ONB05_09745 [candidate division KSB1 bacterium]|nr:hypothetical protein [candidate division KSB1 bacterium]